ncbi:SDR family NAD(P)-dependent oxidoreductase [Thermocatellispora tengchongensis]
MPEGGAMVAVAASEEEVVPVLAGEGGVSVAAVNGPRSVVVSGDEEAVLKVAALFAERGCKTRRLRVSHAFHSPRMEGMVNEFDRVVRGLSFRPARIPVVSNLTGRIAGEEIATPEYWVRHVREPVRFADGVRTLAGTGVRRFLELGPDAVLAPMISDVLAPGEALVVVPALRADRPEPVALQQALGALHVTGTDVDWTPAFAGTGARPAELPTYAFQRRRFWLEPPPPSADGWRYRAVWQARPEPTGTPAGAWLAVVPRALAADPWIAAVTDGLAGCGLDLRTLVPAEDDESGEHVDRERLAGLLPRDVAGVLAFTALADGAVPGGPAGVTGTALLLQAAADAGLTAPIWCLTRGAVSVSPHDPLPNPIQAASWGLGRVAALELPHLWGGLVDLPGAVDERALRRLCGVLTGTEDQAAVRAAGVFARRLVRAGAPETRRTWRTSGTALITGGTGALGAGVARWLAGRGAEHIVLVSRHGPDAPGVAEPVGEISASGVRVTVAACDVADHAALDDLVRRIEAAGPPIRTVVHAAGVSHYGAIAETAPDELAAVVNAKLNGARHLDALFGDRRLDAFLLFSSVAAVWGSGGAGAYAAGNAYLDALAAQRRARGLAATSIAWGPWDGDGMVARDGTGDRLRRHGLVPMDPARAITLMGQALDLDETAVAVADIDWDRFVRGFTARRPSPLIAGLADAGRRPAEPDPGRESEPGLARRLAAASPGERDTLVADLVRAEAAAVLGHGSARDIEPERAFRDLGFDSMTAVELRDRLAAATGLRLPSTLVFDHPTPAALARELHGELLGLPAATDAPAAAATGTDEPMAIIGMACRFPGGAASPEDLWRLVAEGTDAISAFPEDRHWDLDALFHPDPDHPGTSYVREGGFLYDAAEFDAGFFGISPREALAMDPQQRLVLETSWELFERAGIDPATLRGSRTGVFVGASASGYGSAQDPRAEGHALTGSVTSVISGRVAYTFGFEGPAVTVDTACSSSLVALHLAGQSLRAGECDLALAGGVSVLATPAGFTQFSRQGGLARDGRCKSFAAAADGTGWAEGVGVLLVERLSDARRNGHHVLAVVRGSATNQDGASNGLTAPNGLAQQRVVRQALANAGVSASEVDAVEAHGTGTTLGDPIEAQALLATYGQGRERPLWLGSIKSNIGHTAAASGVAGVIKMVMAMRHGVLPKTLHVDEPSPHVDWSAGAVELLTEARAWESAGPRRAGVSSFGISGTNAHVIVEEAPEVEPVPVADPVLRSDVVPLVLSGRDDAGLRAVAGQVAGVLAERSLPDVAWSLLSRPVLDRRAVVLAADRDAALAGLSGIEPVEAGSGRSVFVFPGQGWQWAGMTAGLLDSSPVFAEAMAECERALGVPVVEILRSGAELERVDVVQPVLFAVMVSLARLWRACGVEPRAVVGHSQGEVAAACVAGALSLEDAARVVVARSRAVAEVLSGQGGMAVARMPLAEAEELIAGREVEIAAVNGPAQIVLSGAVDDLLTDERVRRIGVDYASHCAQVEAIRDRLLAELADITPRQADLPMWSTVTGGWTGGGELDADYWYANLRNRVRFGEAVEALTGDGFDAFIEVSAHPVLAQAIEHPHVIPTLRRDSHRFIDALARAHTAGIEVDWRTVVPPARRIDLPTYPFQRRRYWPAAPGIDAARGPVVLADGGGVVLNERLPAGATPQYAATAIAEMVVRAGDEVGCGRLAELTVENGVSGAAHVQVAVRAAGPGGRREVVVHTRAGDGEWARHATGAVEAAAYDTDEEAAWALDGWGHAADTEPFDGGTAQGRAWRAGGVFHVEAALTGGDGREPDAFLLHPDLLLAALRPVLPDAAAPVSWHGVAVFATGATAVRARLTPGADGTCSAELADHSGRLVAVVESLSFGAVAEPEPGGAYRLEWTEIAPPAGAEPAVLGDPRDLLAHDAPLPATVLYRLGRPDDTAGLAASARVLTEQAAGTLARWLADERTASSRLVFLTRGAVTTGRGDPRPDPAHASVAGLVRSARAEHPDRFALIDLDDADAFDTDMLAATAGREPEAALRAGAVLVPRLVPAQPRSDAPRIDGEVLVVGPPTGLAATIARHLASRHGGRLVVTHPGWADTPDAAVTVLPDEPGAIVAARPSGVVYAGDPDGAVRLHELGLRPDWFVLLASEAGALGSSGRPGDAAAGAFLAALAARRRADGLPATCLACGPYGDEAARDGFAPLPAGRVAELFDQALALGEPVVLLLRPDDPAVLGDRVGRSPGRTARRTAATAADDLALTRRLAALSPAEADRLLLHKVQAYAAAVLGHQDGTTVEADRAFKDLGFDSLTSMELRNRLNGLTGLRLPATLAFTYPTPADLARYLRDRLLPDRAASAEGELHRLEELLTGLQPGDDAGDRIAERLQGLLDRWRARPSAGAGALAAENLESVTAEEMFDLIDKELGTP